jgi:hypothetical protein
VIPAEGLFVIDNPLQAHLLMAKLKAALPLPALATPPLLAQLHEQAPGRDLSPRCQITGDPLCGRRRRDPMQSKRREREQI